MHHRSWVRPRAASLALMTPPLLRVATIAAHRAEDPGRNLGQRPWATLQVTMTACATSPTRRLLVRAGTDRRGGVCRPEARYFLRGRPRYSNGRTMRVSLGTPVADTPTRFGVITMSDSVREVIPRGRPTAGSPIFPPERGRVSAILFRFSRHTVALRTDGSCLPPSNVSPSCRPHRRRDRGWFWFLPAPTTPSSTADGGLAPGIRWPNCRALCLHSPPGSGRFDS